MSIHIYNSLTRKKEEFIPLNPPQVNIYTCGVTVYDESHIGHARSLYTFDVIRRYLAYRGFKVKFVRNITDIDDKIINKANELKVPWSAVTEKFIASYKEDLSALGIQEADFEPKATANIQEMVEYISSLVEKGFAYESGGDVYFNVRKFPGYGKLSGQSVDQMEAGSRIGPSELKKDPLDFVLWKKSKENEPYWTSPWGEGRPGWHIECSVMSQKFLKAETLDIHAGGRDLIFPHHENELAQAEALTGKPFAKYWIHHGLLTISSQKMAKSLGNFITIKDFLAKYANADILKLFFSSAHYSHPIDYNAEKIEESKQALERIMIFLDNVERKTSRNEPLAACPDIPNIQKVKDKFIEAMDDDFNAPKALASIFELVNLANKHIEDNSFILAVKKELFELAGILGLALKREVSIQNMPKEVLGLIEARNSARARKDFAEADRIRKRLEDERIILEDTPQGTICRRKL